MVETGIDRLIELSVDLSCTESMGPGVTTTPPWVTVPLMAPTGRTMSAPETIGVPPDTVTIWAAVRETPPG